MFENVVNPTAPLKFDSSTELGGSFRICFIQIIFYDGVLDSGRIVYKPIKTDRSPKFRQTDEISDFSRLNTKQRSQQVDKRLHFTSTSTFRTSSDVRVLSGIE